jgi:tRNA pseudouridine55 synthase
VSEACDGLLAIDKPAGPTSHDLVARVRAWGGVRRVGHTGTLDPPATGLLLLVLGRATRLARFVPDAPKTYLGTLALGVTTTTDDLSGEVVMRHAGPLPEPQTVVSTAACQLGRQMQVPPAYSARQIGGTRMYRLARRGVAVDAAASEVFIERFVLEPTGEPSLWAFELVVSTGTYVRAIARDLGRALGCGAAVASLRRTAIGPLHVDRALGLPDQRNSMSAAIRSRIIPVDEMPLSLPSIVLESTRAASRFAAGVVITDPEPPLPDSTLAAVRGDGGRLLGIGLRGHGTIRPQMVLAEEGPPGL